MERVASGLRKSMNVSDVFMYNSLTISFFSMMWFLLYAYKPVAFPVGSLSFGTPLLFLVSAPFFYSYYYLSSRMPITGGDYIFQSRIINPGVGFVTTFTGWVVWQLFFLAWFGYYIADVLLLPLIYYLIGPHVSNFLYSPVFIFFLTLVLFFLAFYIVIKGLDFYVKLQKLIFALMMLAGASALVIAFSNARFSYSFNFSFTASYFWQSVGTWSLSWGALGYGMWSSLNSEEIHQLKSIKYFLAMVGAALINVLFVVLLWIGLNESFGYSYISKLSESWFSGNLTGIYALTGGPYYTAMMTNLRPNPVLFFILIIGAAVSMFQVIVAILIGASRVVLSQAADGILPRKLAVVSDRTHSPVFAALFGLIVSLIWLYLIVFVPAIGPYFVSVVFATQITWIFTMLATTISGIKHGSFKAVTAGVAGLLLNSFIAYLYVAYPQLGFVSETSILTVALVTFLATVYYLTRDFQVKKKYGMFFEEAIKEIVEQKDGENS
ncbi:MAG: amino acid permease [Nitrososphaeria archaeon]